MLYKTKIYCEGDDNGKDIEVEYSVSKSHGMRDSLGGIPNAGPPLEPDEVEVEIERVADMETGRNIELKTHEEKKILEEIYYEETH
jgi:hypothetical protein